MKQAKGPGQSITKQLLSGRTEEMLAPMEVAFRDKFIQEYIVDFRGDLALYRTGFTDIKTARKRAYNLLREPYVAQRISAILREIRPQDVVARGQVMARLWHEANDPGNEGSTRVAACAHIARMLGMDKPKEDVTRLTGVMMVPVMTLTDWETSAATSQQVLKQAVKE